jgi:hypothetical protein
MPAIDDPSVPLQAAIVGRLKSAATGAADRVYDAVPENPTFPYITIGATQIINEKAECLQGAEVYQTVDVWSRARGKGEVKAVARDVIAAIDDGDLSTDAVAVNSCLLEDVNYLDDPDGLTHHAVIIFHILTD